MDKKDLIQTLCQIVLDKLGAIIVDSHIVYTSGKHGTVYINKDAIYPHTKETSELCRLIAEHFANDSVEVVIAPAIGGVVLSQWTAYHLSEITGCEVKSIYAEKANHGNHFIIRRGYSKLVAGRNVLAIEDVLTTGDSIKKVIRAVRALGGNVVGLGAICNRGEVKLEDFKNLPKFFTLIDIKFEVWNAAECPLCAQGVPINTEVGKGREFLDRKKAC